MPVKLLVREGDDVDQRVLGFRALGRRPESHQLDPVLLEQPARVVAEPLVQVFELAGKRCGVWPLLRE